MNPNLVQLAEAAGRRAEQRKRALMTARLILVEAASDPSKTDAELAEVAATYVNRYHEWTQSEAAAVLLFGQEGS